MTEPTWGMKFSQYGTYHRYKDGEKKPDCPEWFGKKEITIWQESGLILWNDVDQKIEKLRGTEALNLLDELQSDDSWKTKGVSVTREAFRIEIELPPRGRRKKGEPEPAPKQTKSEKFLEEVIHLPPEAGLALIALLEENKPAITQMAEAETKRVVDAWMELYRSTFVSIMRDFDLASRDFEWSYDDRESRIICHHQDAEGRVRLDKSYYRWQACTKRDGYSGDIGYFSELLEAVEWVEKNIVDLAEQVKEEKGRRIISEAELQENRIRLVEKFVGSSFWIAPETMEPKRMTYQVIIDIAAKPISVEKYETICGDTIELSRRYPTCNKLANMITIDPDLFDIQQPIGEMFEFYRITSLTNYYHAASASEQAQKVWNGSSILHQFKAGYLEGGRYGYREVETGFIVLLGECGAARYLLGARDDRQNFMEEKALRETISYSLDVNDYRDFIGATPDLLSDDELIETMHRNRSRSKVLPDDIRRESRVWIAEHSVAD